jgi:hypothetical protein
MATGKDARDICPAATKRQGMNANRIRTLGAPVHVLGLLAWYMKTATRRRISSNLYTLSMMSVRLVTPKKLENTASSKASFDP